MRIPSLFGKSRGAPPPYPEFFDAKGGTLYAVGDIHGELHLLERLVKKIRADVERSQTEGEKTVVFMGDYVDRGPDSRGVLEYLAELDIPDSNIVFLRGNHEQQMIDFIDRPYEKRRWLEWGGDETLASFDIEPLIPTAEESEFINTAKTFGEAFGGLRKFIEEKTVLYWQTGNIVFSHGGMDPSLPVDEQRPRTMLWGSESFMRFGGPSGFWHVHGHVIHESAGIFGNRIAVDTGAYKTGVLTAARITDNGCAFLEQT